MKIAVCVPSRGLVHSRTLEHIIDNLKGKDWQLYTTHNLPIPECFNNLTERALENDYLWFVEEDMGFTNDTLDKLLAADCDIATIDYAVTPEVSTVDYDKGKIVKIGTGCTLIKKEVFAKIKEPYWRTDHYYSLPDWKAHKILKDDKDTAYGRQDVDFCQRATKAGFTIKSVGRGWQYRIKQYGKMGVNKGYHEVEVLDAH